MSEKIKYPLLITQTLIDEAKNNNLLCSKYLELGKYICVNVGEQGYFIPHTASVIETLDYAEKACDSHNRYLGYSKNEADKIIYASMNKTLSIK